MRTWLFQLSSDPGISLQRRLREMMVSAILDGHLPAGEPVPSCRSLARQLGVARNTVVLAYQQLVDQGYLVARERSGYFVDRRILDGQVSTTLRAPAAGTTGLDWQRRLRTLPSRLPHTAKPTDWQRFPYPFIYGQLDPALFPINDWRECARQALSVDAIRDWSMDRIDADDPLLVEQIRTRLLPRRGVWAAPGEILITLGTQQALYLLAALLVSHDTVVGLENPGYVDARNIFALHSARLLALPVDAEGLCIDARLGECELLYTTPSHQFPTTVTLSLARRRALLREASRHDLVIIEDDYESEANFVGAPTPALKSLDREGRVIYLGSLSKTLAPGLRLGYLVAPAPLIHEARAIRRLMLRHPPSNNQRTVALFLALGHHDTLVHRLARIYRRRWQLLGEALAHHLPDSSRSPTFGGTAFWVAGPGRLDAGELHRRAAEQGILIEQGNTTFFGPSPPGCFFRLGFSAIATERIEPGVARLAALIKNLCDSPR